MSYILEALKKSEKERQDGAVPSFDSQQGSESAPLKKKKPWHFFLIGALLLNAAIFLWWIRPWRTVETELPVKAGSERGSSLIVAPVDTTMPDEVADENAVTAGTPQREALQVIPGQEKETADQEKGTDVVPSSPELSPAAVASMTEDRDAALNVNLAEGDEGAGEVRRSEADSGEPEERAEEDLSLGEQGDDGLGGQEMPSAVEEKGSPQDNAVAEKRRPAARTSKVKKGGAVSGEAAPDIAQLPVSIQQQLPEISISLHLYSKQPQRRKVSVNGSMMREKDRLGTLTVEEITPDGVIFSFRGTRFHKGVFR